MSSPPPHHAPLVVCYVPGLDARLVDAGATPFIDGLRRRHPVVELTTLPNTELLPTIATGVWPHQHGVWQVSLRPNGSGPYRRTAADGVPDLVSTTLQCLRHLVDREYDLAAIPLRRRRRFELHRFKYTRRAASDGVMGRFGRYDSIFGVLGPDARYRFTRDFGRLSELARELPSGGRRLEFLEMYAFDLTQHWHLDDVPAMERALARTDAFVRDLHDACRERGARLLLLVDHGQERVVGTVPLVPALGQTGVSEREFSYFVELGLARLWFHTDRARRTIRDRLAALEHTTLIDRADMRRYDVAFDDDAYGELYVAADAGRIFFPHDFYQPLANLFLGLTDRRQRPRAWNPIHRGNHGYLPQHPSERGWMVLADNLSAERDTARLIDVAPTLLALVGRSPAPHMSGRSVYRT